MNKLLHFCFFTHILSYPAEHDLTKQEITIAYMIKISQNSSSSSKIHNSKNLQIQMHIQKLAHCASKCSPVRATCNLPNGLTQKQRTTCSLYLYWHWWWQRSLLWGGSCVFVSLNSLLIFQLECMYFSFSLFVLQSRCEWKVSWKYVLDCGIDRMVAGVLVMGVVVALLCSQWTHAYLSLPLI